MRVIVALLIALCAAPSYAAGIGAEPGPRYAHNDPSAIAAPVERGADPRKLMRIERQLTQQVDAQPEHVGLRAALGYVQALRNELESSAATYAKALALAGEDAELVRHVMWSRGWALLDLGDAGGALAAWREAERLHGGAPFWVPYTYAIGLWANGERDAAVRWYAAAARDFPDEWGTKRGLGRSTAHWQPKERALAKAVFAAWDKSR